MERMAVKELERRASEIVRDVGKNAREYIITVDGAPLAVLRPFAPMDEPPAAEDEATYQARVTEWLRELDVTAARIAEHWPEGVSAVDAVRQPSAVLKSATTASPRPP